MKTSTKNLDKCRVQLTVKLTTDEVTDVVKSVEKTFMREAELPGFRKGKVPLEVIRKQFADGLKRETEHGLLRKYYPEAVKAESIDEVALADVQDLICEGEGKGGFTAIVEVKPKFKLPTYKGLKLESKDVTIKDATVNEQMMRLRAAYATYEDAKAGEEVADGDFVQIDYSGMIGKKSILEINPEAKIVGEGKGFWTQVEEGRFLPEILDAVKGMKIGETKDGIKAKFDKSSAPEGLKGEKAVYTITLKAFRRRILPTDAEFVEKAKAESLDKLTATVRENMEKSAIAEEARRRENEALELLLKKCDFDVPSSQVRRAMDGYLQELAERAQYSGLNAEYFEKNRDQIMKDAEAVATKQVRLWYILDAIAKVEGISEGERPEVEGEGIGKKVVEFILANAKK